MSEDKQKPKRLNRLSPALIERNNRAAANETIDKIEELPKENPSLMTRLFGEKG